MGNQGSNANMGFGQEEVSLRETPSENSHKGLTVIDVFSGCGGSSYGFKLAGFDVKAAIDKNPLATESYKLNFPGTSIL
jgi:tRNA G37 N-methylase Trm5